MTPDNFSLLVDIFSKLTILAFLTESLTEVVKDTLPLVDRLIPSRFISLIIAMACAYGFGVDITVMLNDRVDLPGIVMTGIIASRGANFVNDKFFMKINKLRKAKAES